MPRNTREWARRKLDEACNNIDWSGKHLYEVSETYKQYHPEISEPLDEALKVLLLLQEQIQQLKDSF